MSASSSFGFRGLLTTALAKAGAWLVEPAESACAPLEIRARPAVAVVGLAPGCGTTTVARALAVELAVRDPSGAAVVAGEDPGGAVRLGSAAAGRLARALGEPESGGLRTVGRLCLVASSTPARLTAALRHLAPVVFDVTYGGAAGVPASLADHVLLVAAPGVEPALATVVAASLSRIGPEPRLIVNRAEEPGPWAERAAFLLGESRAGARLACAGRQPRGRLLEDLAQVAHTCEMPGSTW